MSLEPDTAEYRVSDRRVLHEGTVSPPGLLLGPLSLDGTGVAKNCRTEKNALPEADSTDSGGSEEEPGACPSNHAPTTARKVKSRRNA